MAQLAGVDDVDSVVGPTGGGGVESVVDADGICRTHEDIDLISVDPSNRCRFAGSPGMASCDRAAVHECHDPAVHVLVDAGESVDGDLDSGLFFHLALNSLLQGLVQLENASWGLPLAVVASLDH